MGSRCSNSSEKTLKKIPHLPRETPHRELEEKCPWVGEYGDYLSKHVHRCDYAVIDCPQGCGEKILRGGRPVHDQVGVVLHHRAHLSGSHGQVGLCHRRRF